MGRASFGRVVNASHACFPRRLKAGRGVFDHTARTRRDAHTRCCVQEQVREGLPLSHVLTAKYAVVEE